MTSSKSGNSPDFGFLSGGNMAYLESLYQESVGNGAGDMDAESLENWKPVFSELSAAGDITQSQATNGDPGSLAELKSAVFKQARVSKLIMTYRAIGHLLADVDPIGVMPRGDAREIELEQYGLSEADLDSEFEVGSMGHGGTMTLRNILAYLKSVYCKSIGYEIRYLHSLEQRGWLIGQVEKESKGEPYPPEERVEVLDRLTAAEGLEKYLHTKYVGQKRFSLEGGDSLIPMVSDLIQQFGARGVKEIVIGMAHRGRLNMLVNILGKAPKDLFSEFEGEYETEDEDTNTGDVKYHQGASSDIQTRAVTST